MITPHAAKQLIANKLLEMGLTSRLSARTVSFADLARGSRLFVTIHDWKPDSRWGELQDLAHANGFIVSDV